MCEYFNDKKEQKLMSVSIKKELLMLRKRFYSHLNFYEHLYLHFHELS